MRRPGECGKKCRKDAGSTPSYSRTNIEKAEVAAFLLVSSHLPVLVLDPLPLIGGRETNVARDVYLFYT